MRRTVGWLALIAMIACEPVTQPTTTTDPVLPPPDPLVTTTNPRVSTTEFVPIPDQVVVGALPDGLDYRLTIPGGVIKGPVHITGDFVVEVDGEQAPAGEVSYRNDGGQGESFNGTHLLLTAGGWTIAIDFYEHVLGRLGADAEQIVAETIEATTKSGFPALRLSPPFAWDYENHPPEVRFGPFVIRRFCGDLAIACNDIRSVQVIPASDAYPGFEPLDEIPTVLVDSRDARSILDPYYIDPGPLSSRGGPDLHWTGKEMIVWGGGGFDESDASDGARFNPETNEWAMLPPIPLDHSNPTRSVWLGRFLVVVTEEGSFAHVPGTTGWTTYESSGVAPPREPGAIVSAGRWLYLRNHEGIFRLSLRAPDLGWIAMDDPPFSGVAPGFDDRHYTSLISADHHLHVVRRPAEACKSKEIARRDDEQWIVLPSVSLATLENADCSYAYQIATAGSRLVLWDAGHPTMVYSTEAGTWTEADPIPVGGQESPSGPVAIDDRYFMVPQDGTAAFFDGQSNSWSAVDLPVPSYSMVWTGSEFLAWAGDDAWRWSPPSGLIDG